MFPREMARELETAASGYPIVTMTGPRQSGKTTLVRQVFPHKPYVSLEDLDQRELAQRDPRGFLSQFPDGAILDEIQHVPTLLSYVQTRVDAENRPGYYILTGSHQLSLHEAVTQSLAGRTALLTLYPLTLSELSASGLELNLNDTLLHGFYPRIFQSHLEPNSYYRNYLATYVERDVRQMLQVQNLVTFQRFLKLCAGRIGQVLNRESLGNDLGVSSHTVKSWLSILEASFLIVQLPPYFENFGKRAIKSPKLYFTDVGVATALLGIENQEQLDRDPLRGQLFENLVVMELIKARANSGKAPQLYFYRDSAQHEVDLIFQRGHELIPIEIKSSMTFHYDLLRSVRYFRNLVGDRAAHAGLIYSGVQEPTLEGIKVLNYHKARQLLS